MINKKDIKNFFILLCIIPLTGCVAMLGKNNTNVTINSEPSDAEIRVDGVFVGKTPSVVPLSNDKPHIITLEKEGYEKEAVNLGNEVNPGLIVLETVLTGGIGLVVDSISGSFHQLEKDKISVQLKPKAVKKEEEEYNEEPISKKQTTKKKYKK